MTKIPKLFQIMEERKLTAKEISKETNISQGNISDWKSGRSAPTLDNLVKLANYLEVSTDYLLGIAPNENKNDLSDDDIELLDAFQKLPDIKKGKVIGFAEGLLAETGADKIVQR